MLINIAAFRFHEQRWGKGHLASKRTITNCRHIVAPFYKAVVTNDKHKQDRQETRQKSFCYSIEELKIC